MEAGTRQLPDIRGSATLETAARFMLFWDTDRVEVFDDRGRSRGIVTEGDLVRSIAKGGRPGLTEVQELLEKPHIEIVDPERRKVEDIPPLREPVARDVMSTPAVACAEGASLDEVAELLADREISGMPVVDELERVVGVISERDLARALGAPLIRLAIGQPVQTGSFLRQPRIAKCAADIMSAPPVVGHPETPLHEIALKMIQEQINRVPIVDDERLVGIVSRGDILAVVARMSKTSRTRSTPATIVGKRVRSRVQDVRGDSNITARTVPLG